MMNFSRQLILGTLIAFQGAPLYGQDITELGGALTSGLPGRAAIQVNAPNVTDEARKMIQLGGFGKFHSKFKKSTGLGPDFVNSGCGACHLDNGKGPTKFSKTNRKGSSMVLKVSLKGLKKDGSPRDVPGIGEQILDQSVRGARKASVTLEWKSVKGKYPDGTTYTLRRPLVNFIIEDMNRRGLVSSLRMTPPVIGPGLLEAIPDSVILENNDPDDVNGDGISGHPNYVLDAVTGEYAIGRFGFRGSHTTVEQQTAAALFHDIGITTRIIPGRNKQIEFDDESLTLLTAYQKLAGVPRAKNQEAERVIAGKELFKTIGCDACHRMTMTTGNYADPELSNQEFHPFTDLLLHDMGTGLADKRAEFSASGREWRTTPLWGLGFAAELRGGKVVYLHDGRARTVEEAILWHGGEAAGAQDRFKNLAADERAKLIEFLNSL